MTIQTEYEFTLPKGYVDESGRLHRNGRMRLATVYDEVESVEHAAVKAKPSYLPVLLLARVVVQLGDITPVTPKIIARLFAADMLYLQDMYLRLNDSEIIMVGVICPHCQNQFQLQVAPLA